MTTFNTILQSDTDTILQFYPEFHYNLSHVSHFLRDSSCSTSRYNNPPGNPNS